MTPIIAMPGFSEWYFIMIALGIMVIPRVFYLISLQSALDSVSPVNRKMPSGNVWLLLIPIFSFVWHFIVVKNISESLSAEANARQIQLDQPKPGYGIGLAMCILNCCFIVPGLNVLTIIASLVCWIIYWTSIVKYKARLMTIA